MSEDDAVDDDDWFEQALADDQSSIDASPDDQPHSVSDDTSVDDEENSSGGKGTEQSKEDGFDAADPHPDELDAAFEAATEATPMGEIGGEQGDDPFGGADDGGDLFDDDFASSFGSGGGESETFDDENFESSIPRLDVGIEGLDTMIRGGVPQRHLMVVIGSAGTGKTTFGLQYLQCGLEQGENCVFITLEQSHEAILDTAAEHGWDFETCEVEDQLAVIDLDPIEMANSLDNIRDELPTLVERFDADRFVLDSVSLLEMMYDDQASRRTDIFDFTRSLKQAGVTTLLTSEADEDNPYASRHGIIEYLTDAVFVLQYVREASQETRLAVEIQKIRNANHSRETKPYEITDEGISVYDQANIF